MLQTGSCQNNHLIFKSSFNNKRKGRERFLPFAIFVVQNKEKLIYENASALYAPDWESSSYVCIAVQRKLSKVRRIA